MEKVFNCALRSYTPTIWTGYSDISWTGVHPAIVSLLRGRVNGLG